MNKLARAPYVALTALEYLNGGNCVLCAFCRFGDWQGECSSDGYYRCRHPLLDSGDFDDILAALQEGDGQDCWAFRPQVSFEVAHGMWTNFAAGKDVILEPEHLLGKVKQP